MPHQPNMTTPAAPDSDDVVFVIPVFNDWEALKLVLERLSSLPELPRDRCRVLVVDDHSSVTAPASLAGNLPPNGPIRDIHVLRLRRNMGHQRALAIGLMHVYEQMPCEGVVVMDGDGEDKPEDVPKLLELFHRLEAKQVVFAERRRRTEGIVFRFSYWAYRTLHLMLVGFPVRVGNFSVVPRPFLSSFAVAPELWNHYAAAIFRLRLPHQSIKLDRGERYAGRAKVGFTGLVLHGLSAISVFIDTVGLRILLVSIVIGALLLGVAVGAFLLQRLYGGATPAWAFFLWGLLVLLLAQVANVSAIVLIQILNSRSSFSFLPLRDYALFVESVSPVEGRVGPFP